MKEPRDEDFSSLQTLLRLKRYETPPTDSMEDFLWEFHRRQRTELLRRPLWRIALDRVESLFTIPTFSTTRLAYAGSCAVALTLAATGLLSRGFGTASGPIAATPQSPVNAGSLATDYAAPRERFVLTAPPSALRHSPIEFGVPVAATGNASLHFANTGVDIDTSRSASPGARSLRPRYVLESQPVRYEPRSSTF
jgi:hypothetical protein